MGPGLGVTWIPGGTCHSSTGLARPAGRPAGRASSRNPPNLDPAYDKPASGAPFSGICRGRPTCWTSGRSGGLFWDAFWDVRLGRSGKGQKKSKNESSQKCSIVENIPTPRESLLELFLTSQLQYRAKIQKLLEKYRITYFLYQPALELLPISEMRSPGKVEGTAVS